MLIVVLLLLANPCHAAESESSECSRILIELKGAQRTFTREGIELLKHSRDVLRRRFAIFEGEYKNMYTVHHAATVARLMKGNMLLYGPPGGAKSSFVNWIMLGEHSPPYKLQMHQMITEQAFVGGQKWSAAREGVYEVNTKGSLADFEVALIDEIEKGNPAALAALLSLLNERTVLTGGHVVQAKLETLFSTSNANLSEILTSFIEQGQGTTAPALLNRFQFKAFLYNWLNEEHQAALDELRQKRNRNQALTKLQKKKHNVDQAPEPPTYLDWQTLRSMAHLIFQLDEFAVRFLRSFVNSMRLQTHDAIRQSEQKYRNHPEDEYFVYFPSADYTERLRGQVSELIIMSAFVDFLLSSRADDPFLEQTVNQGPRELGPDSTWRSFLMLTTIGPGHSKVSFNSENKVQKKGSQLTSGRGMQLNFSWPFDEKSARDAREQALIQNLQAEQQRFAETLTYELQQFYSRVEKSLDQYAPDNFQDLDPTDFEHYLYEAPARE